MSGQSPVDGMHGDAPASVPEIRHATPDQIALSAAILEEVANRGAHDGHRSWAPGNFTGPDARGMAPLRRDAATSSLFLVWVGDVAVATFSLLEDDARIWPDATPDALYLHRFGVRRMAAGTGRWAIEWMVAEVRRRGRAYLRLDCLAENPGIRRYYEKAGFVEVGEMDYDGIPLSLYEMPVPPFTPSR